MEETFAEIQQVATQSDHLGGVEIGNTGQHGFFLDVQFIFQSLNCQKLLVHNVVQDDVHQESRSVPGALHVCLHDVLNAIQNPAVVGIALADCYQKVFADKQIDFADRKFFV